MTRYRKQYSRDVERFRTCRCCNGTNTEQIGLSDDFDHERLAYVGWCWDCDRPYSYNTRLENIYDREERI